MKKVLGLVFLSYCVMNPALAQPLSVVYPPDSHQTTSDRIFLIGSASPTSEVLVNGKPIKRSQAGHFAPSFPLQLGDNLFSVQYQNQQVQIKVRRLASTPQPPVGLAFAQDSLTPSVDIARLPGEVVCFGAIASPNANVSVKLGDRTIPLFPQTQQIQLPANSAALIRQNQPSVNVAAQYQGCMTMPVGARSMGTLYPHNKITEQAFEYPTNLDLGKPEFQLTLNGKTITQSGKGKITVVSPAQLPVIEVIADAGIARTGASTDYSRLTPLPKGTRAAVTGKDGEWLRLDYGGWINSQETRIIPGAVPPRSLIRSVVARQISGATEIVFPLQVPVPISVQQGERSLTLTLYNTTAQTDIIRLDDNPIISRLDWQQVSPGQVQYIFNFKSGQQWGYKLRYDGTNLVLLLRHAPCGKTGDFDKIPTTEAGLTDLPACGKTGNFDKPTSTTEAGLTSRGGFNRQTGGKTGNFDKPAPSAGKQVILTNPPRQKPLSGIKILLDPGHGGAELGSRGPTGYPEKEINLVISKLVREELLRLGATVYMTREEDKEVSLTERVAMIDKLEPAIAVSIHYNALPDGGDAMNTKGISAFWYHPQAHSLALFLHNYLVKKLNRADYGVYWNNLALTRPASAPSVLLELGFMINPMEFEWIVNPQAQKKLASAIAQAITQWFRKGRYS